MTQLFAERLRSARILNGFSLQDLADQLDNRITKQSLHKYEKGEVVPDSEMIGYLAEALQVRSDFFFREMKVELGTVEFRKLKKLPVKEEHKLIEKVKDELERYLELEEILSLSTVFENPVDSTGPVRSLEDVEAATQAIREKWKLGCDPIANCFELLEDHHIKVIELQSEGSFDGLQTWVNGKIPVVAVNTAKLKSPDRKRFTVVHELAHLLLSFEEEISERDKERFCHQFAASLLLPDTAAFEELGRSRSKLMIQELGALKKEYGISIQAIVMRAKDLGIISESYSRQFFFYITQMGWRTTEPYEYGSEEKSGRFEKLLFRALAEDYISMGKAAALKNQTLAEFKEKSLLVV